MSLKFTQVSSRWATRLFCTVTLLMLAPLAFGDEPEAADCGDIRVLAFMLGTWGYEAEGTVFEERWVLEADGTMTGAAESSSAADGTVFQVESMRIVAEQSRLVYHADPDADGAPVPFVLVACEAGSARFENPDHDFPQRLHYQSSTDGGLTAAVEDLDGNGFDLQFQPRDDSGGG